jgi:hypothetical protein
LNAIKEELRHWFSDLCGNDMDCEQKLRYLLRQDKGLIRNINYAYNKTNVIDVKKLIKEHLSIHKIIVRTCKHCNKKNLISSEVLKEAECEQCNNKLLESKKIVSQVVQSDESLLKERKNCIYCGNPVSSISNSFTCYSCKNVGFDVYPKW